MDNKDTPKSEANVNQPSQESLGVNSSMADGPISVLSDSPNPPQQVIPPQQPIFSASQMGINTPNKKSFRFTFKKLLKCIGALIIIGGILGVLILNNVIVLSEFKDINYINSEGTQFRIKFYTKHATDTHPIGAQGLVSKVSKDGKLPLVLLIKNVDEQTYTKAKDCLTQKRVFEVQNIRVNQKISVCDSGAPFRSADQYGPGTTYDAAFTHNGQAYIIYFGPDYTGINWNDPNDPLLDKVGLKPYEDDIRTIVSSILPVSAN